MNGGGPSARFSETAPRPPVFPGEENVQGQVRMDPQWAQSQRFAGGSRRVPSHYPPSGGVAGASLSPSKGSSPILTPRLRHGHSTSLATCSSSSSAAVHAIGRDLHDYQECESLRRYEAAEGSASTSPPLAETPPYLRWAENLHYLLADPDGVALFEKYLEQENCSHLLKFWFACEGLKRQWTEDSATGVQIINLIHRKYIRPRKVHVSELVRKEINDRVADKSALDAHIFDEAQKEVEDLVRDSAYANFLNSDVYLSYIQSMQNAPPDSPRSGRSLGGSEVVKGSSASLVDPLSGSVVVPEAVLSNALPTLHEDAEFTCPSAAGASSSDVKALPLTLSALHLTEKKRALMNFEARPLPGSFAGRVVHHPYHATSYAPYNPVSRQDSEIQSLSSDAHTDDNRSLTDSSVDGASGYFNFKPSRSQQRRQQQRMKSNAMQNRDPGVHQTFIPRTQRPPKEQLMPQQPKEFAALLIQKLEAVKRERESEEKLSRKLSERDGDTSGMEDSIGPPPARGFRQGPECTARDLADALAKIATSIEPDTQSILDNHVQRIWSDQTPLRSPGVPSPRPWSPENRRRGVPPIINQSKGSLAPSMGGSSYSTGSSSFFQRSSAHHRRKDKDVGSTLSADSGAMDVGEPMGGRDRDSCSLHFKSQSIPETSQRRPVGGSSSSAIGACGALASASCSSGKKASEFGDSGLCLLTDTPSTTLMAPPPVPPKEKVLHWIMNNDKCQEGDRADPSSIKYRSRPPSSTSPISSRRSRKQAPYNSSRSESLERSGAGGPVGGSSLVQPDCSAAAIDSRNRPPTKPKPAPVAPVVAVQSSTLKKPANAATSAGDVGVGGSSTMSSECTVVMFTFGEEPVPYRSKISGRTVTLRQFKDILPKKGNYKYYFKTNCDDDVAQAVYQEVMDESEVLPLWEDKVLGLVKLID